MKTLIDTIDRFVKSDRGLRVPGISAGIVLLTAVASIGANDTLAPTTQSDIADPGLAAGGNGDTGGATPTPTATVGSGSVGGPGGPASTGGGGTGTATPTPSGLQLAPRDL